MATFIQGVTDQFGPMQLYRPDYQFLTQVYGTRQAQYDRGFNMVKSLYNSALNNGLTNAENETYRQEAFKKAQASMKSLAAVDLANPTNVMRAQSLVDPIVKDQDLAYDMAVTRFHQKQKQIMETYRNSTDPKMRAMYNEYSRMDIGLAEEDLRSAKRGDGSIQSVQPREFTPFEDVMEYLRKAAKDEGLEITESGPDGRGYIFKRVNGKGVIPIFDSWAKATMGNRFDRQFGVIGRVNAESAIRSEMSAKGVSKEEATRLVAEKLLPEVNTKKSIEGITADKEFKKIDEEVKFFEKQYPNGFPPSKPEIAEEYQRLVKARDDYKNDFENSRNEVGRLQEEGSQYIASNLYGIYSQEAKSQTALAFASTFATAKQSVEMRPDTMYATRLNIASRERIAAANLAMQEKKLKWDVEKFGINTELKMMELKGKGYVPSEELVGQGVSDTPAYASDLQTQAVSDNRNQAFQSAFNGENGLMKLVVDNDADFGKYYSTIAKVKQMANGQQVKLTAEDQNNLRAYGQMVGINVNIPANAGTANAVLDGLAGYTYTKASDKLALYSRTHKSGKADPYMKSFQSAMGAFQTLAAQRDKLNQDMKRVTQEVLNPDGSIKDLYKGAKIRSNLGGGVYDIDLTNVSEAAKTRLSGMISGFKDMQNPVSYKYNFSKLSNGEIEQLIRNPYTASSITTSDGATLDLNVLRNMNNVDLQELFGNNSNVFYDPVRKQVKVELNVSQKEGMAKKMGIKGAQVLYVNIPYETIQSSQGVLQRFAAKIPVNSLNTESLGVLTPLMTNPNARILGESYMEKMGFDYNVTGMTAANGNPMLQFNYDFFNPVTGKTQNKSKYIPFKPGDPSTLQNALSIINQEYAIYLTNRKAYEKTLE